MLDQSWPPFLDLLDSDPDAVFRGFYSFAIRLLKLKPPRGMRSLAETEKQDLAQSIVLHCVQDNFAVLRRYSDCGKPFAAWFYVLSHNRCLDYLKKQRREDDIFVGGGECGNCGQDKYGEDPDIDPQERTKLKGAIEIVRACMSDLGQYCQLLLQLAADEYTPREMTMAMGWPADRNKRVSDDLRECRRRLKRLVSEKGIDVCTVLQS
ncbi:MAG: hypothetical protein KKG33_14055 [candidate division Zixibacteria bacterium]|nr:hypothetical protein [candidate division Zixibacteria bacterium]MBU1471311.1 hypothetical protein [candidate division Zixibacteria bacterium]MBU2626676.1 hypothetical protein [candidate division Zixibacteria bacterium]